MTNGNYISLGTILWKVLKNPLCAELSYNEAAEYTLEFLKLVGAPSLFLDKNEYINIEQYKGLLPCDILYIEGIRYILNECCNNKNIAMRESSNIYHLNSNEFESIKEEQNEFTYKLQNGIIFTSIEKGIIEISYKGIATDEEGFPLIPDNQNVLLGLEYYIISRYLEPIWLIGKITDKAFEFINQKRYFYTASASTSCQMPSIDKLETIMNGLNRLIINDQAHKNFFKNFGEKEKIKRQV